MFPLRDSAPVRRWPVVTWGFVRRPEYAPW